MEVGLPVCPTVENPVLVHQETGNSQGMSHARSAERDSRQAIQTWSDHSDGVVPSPRGVQRLYAPGATSHKWTCLPPGSTTNYHSLSHRFQTPRLGQWMHSACLGKIWIHMPFHQEPSWASGGEVTGLPVQQDHSGCTRVVQHALVLGSSGNVQSDPSVSTQAAQSGISTIHPDSAQEPVKPEPTCLAPRATAIKEQGFSEAVEA